MLDGIGDWQRQIGSFVINGYGVFFAGAFIASVVAALYGLRLIEARKDLERQIGVTVSPQADASSPVTAGGTPGTTAIPPKSDC